MIEESNSEPLANYTILNLCSCTYIPLLVDRVTDGALATGHTGSEIVRASPLDVFDPSTEAQLALALRQLAGAPGVSRQLGIVQGLSYCLARFKLCLELQQLKYGPDAVSEQRVAFELPTVAPGLGLGQHCECAAGEQRHDDERPHGLCIHSFFLLKKN